MPSSDHSGSQLLPRLCEQLPFTGSHWNTDTIVHMPVYKTLKFYVVFRFPDFLSSFFICFLASPKSSCQSLLLELKLKWCLLSSCYVEHLFANSQ